PVRNGLLKFRIGSELIIVHSERRDDARSQNTKRFQHKKSLRLKSEVLSRRGSLESAYLMDHARDFQARFDFVAKEQLPRNIAAKVQHHQIEIDWVRRLLENSSGAHFLGDFQIPRRGRSRKYHEWKRAQFR